MPKPWNEPQEFAVPLDLSESIGGHPLVAETLTRRGFSDPETAQAFLDPARYTPTPAAELPDIPKAADRIWQAIQRRERILVWGDFDVDGQTSTTLLVEALRDFGAEVVYHIPLRATEGHGIKVEVLAEVLASSSPPPTVLLTCDTGSAAQAAVDYANDCGLAVIITDHHDLPSELPAAFALVNPKLLPEDHPLASLPGVGVAYKLVEALFDHRPPTLRDDWQPDLNHLSPEKYLDLVTLGIVADVAEQRGDTRYLLQRGLNVLRNTTRLGLQIMVELAQIIPAQLDESTIGFSLGPRLNALGRLSDANPIVEFFTTADPAQVRVLATQLEGLNERRKLLTEQITQAALAQIEREPLLLESAALVLAHPGWHTGVIGIVASRLVERFGKPAILFSIGEDGLARGSARSIEGVHITEAIASQQEFLISFGGHPGAAGLSLPAQEIAQFRRGLSRAVRDQCGGQPPKPVLNVDAYLPLSELSLDLVDEIKRLAPFGAGNPPLTLASQNLKLVSHTTVGRNHEHLRLVVADENSEHVNVLWWNGAGNPLPEADTLFDLAYSLQANTFRGVRQLQIQWVDFRSASAISPENQAEIPEVEFVDFREVVDPRSQLKSILEQMDLQIWAEGEEKAKVQGVDRRELKAGINLAVWTTPPGPREWQAAVAQVNPQKVFLFSVNPKLDNPETFLTRLAGLVKFALRAKGGSIELDQIAAATAQQENTIRMGLLWLEAKGLVRVTRRDEAVYTLTPGNGTEGPALAEIAVELRAMLEETTAYRLYFKKILTDQLRHL